MDQPLADPLARGVHNDSWVVTSHQKSYYFLFIYYYKRYRVQYSR